MKIFKLFCSGIFLMTLVACSVEKIDTTSKEAYVESIKAVSAGLSEPERQELFNNLRVVVMGKDTPLVILKAKAMTLNEVTGMYAFIQTADGQKKVKDFKRLNGLSAEQVVSVGESVFKKAMEKKMYALEANR